MSKLPQVLLRLAEVETATGLSRSSVYDRLNPKSPRFDASFPAPLRVGTVAVRWVQSEVEAWVASRPRTRAYAANDGILGPKVESLSEVA